jgi:hypothetical protein
MHVRYKLIFIKKLIGEIIPIHFVKTPSDGGTTPFILTSVMEGGE